MKAKLASLIAIALCAAMPALAQKRWTGNGSGYWTPTSDTANWNDKSGGATGYFFLYDSSGYGSKTVKFREHTGIGNNIVSVQHKTGTTAESPIVFLADKDEYGFTSTSRLDAGQWLNGHLDIQRGTFACKYIQIGNNSKDGLSTVDCLIKVGGSGHNASLTASGGADSKDTSTIYRGKLLVGAKGSFSFDYYFNIGYWSDRTGTLEVDGGAVTNSAYYAGLGVCAGSTGVLTVKNGGKYENTGSGGDGGGLIVGTHGLGELNVDGGEVIMSVPINVCYYKEGTAAINVTGGGIIRCGGFIYNNEGDGCTNPAAVTVDGGTLQATADSAAFIPNAANMTVTVGENGATIDNGGHDIAIARPVSGTGQLVLTGSGTTTLDIYSRAVPALSVAALSLPESKTVALTFEGGAFPEGMYMIYEAEGVSAADGEKFSPSTGGLGHTWAVDNGVLVLVVGNPAACTWTGRAGDCLFSTQGNWLMGKKPEVGSPDAVIFDGAASSITNDIGELSPSSIVFSGSCGLLEIAGSGFKDVESIVNSASVHHVLDVPVAFKDGIAAVVPCSKNNYIDFAGGMSAESLPVRSEYTYLKGSFVLSGSLGLNTDWHYHTYLVSGSTLKVAYMENPVYFYIETGSSVEADKVLVNGKEPYLALANYGSYTIGEVESQSSYQCIPFVTKDNSQSPIRVRKLVSNGANNLFIICGRDFSNASWIVGDGGFAFGTSGKPSFGVDSGAVANIYTVADFEIGIGGNGRSIYNKGTVNFYTYNYDDPSARGNVITANGVLNTDNANRIYNIYGNGSLVINSASTVSGTLAVKDGATLVVNAGCTPGSGTVNVEAGGTLSAPQPGTATVGTATFAASGILSVKLNSHEDRTKVAIGTTFKAPDSGTISVKVSAADGFSPRSLEPYTLLSGGKVTCDVSKFAFVDAPTWADRLAVESGNLVLYTKRPGLSLRVR